MKIATIILNYNSSADCKRCIGDLLMQENVEQEIIVVDNCSKEEERSAVENLCNELSVTFIANDKNGGYNAGNNIGLRYAAKKGYEYALIANPDMQFPNRDYLQKLLEPMLNDKEIVVCGSDIVTPEGVHQNPAHRDGDWRSCWGWFADLFMKKATDAYSFIDNYTSSHYCSKVSGCCLLVRMSYIKDIGFFDEYPMLYCEEAILSRQVENANKKMYYTTETQAIHAHKNSEKGDPIPRFKQWRRSRLYFIERYSDDTTWGKFMASLSMRLYIRIMLTYNYFKQ